MPMAEDVENVSPEDDDTTGKRRVCCCLPAARTAKLASIATLANAIVTGAVMHSNAFPFERAVRSSSTVLLILLSAAHTAFLIRAVKPDRRSTAIAITKFACLATTLLGVVHLALLCLLVYRCQPTSCWHPQFVGSDEQRARSPIQMDWAGTAHTAVVCACFFVAILCLIIFQRFHHALTQTAAIPPRSMPSQNGDSSEPQSASAEHDERPFRESSPSQRAPVVAAITSLTLVTAFTLYMHMSDISPGRFGSVVLPVIVTAAFVNFELRMSSKRSRDSWWMCAAMAIFAIFVAYFVFCLLSVAVALHSSPKYRPRQDVSEAELIGAGCALIFCLFVTLICICVFLRNSYQLTKYQSPAFGRWLYFSKIAASISFVSAIVTVSYMHSTADNSNALIYDRLVHAAIPLVTAIVTVTFVRFYIGGIRQQHLHAIVFHAIATTLLAVLHLALIFPHIYRCLPSTCLNCCEKYWFVHIDQKGLICSAILLACFVITAACAILLWCFLRIQKRHVHRLRRNLLSCASPLDDTVGLIQPSENPSIVNGGGKIELQNGALIPQTRERASEADGWLFKEHLYSEIAPAYSCCCVRDPRHTFNAAATIVLLLSVLFGEYAQFFYYEPFSALTAVVSLVTTGAYFAKAIHSRKRREVWKFFAVTVLFAFLQLLHIPVLIYRTWARTDVGFFYIQEALGRPSRYWVVKYGYCIAGLFGCSLFLILISSFIICRYGRFLSEVATRAAKESRLQACPFADVDLQPKLMRNVDGFLQSLQQTENQHP